MAKRGRPKKEPKDELNKQDKTELTESNTLEESKEPELTITELKNTTKEELNIISGVFTHIGRTKEFNTELINSTKDRPLKPLITLTEFNKNLSQFKNQKT